MGPVARSRAEVYAVGAYFDFAALRAESRPVPPPTPGAGAPCAFRIVLHTALSRQAWNAAIADALAPRLAPHGDEGRAALERFDALSARMPEQLPSGASLEVHLGSGGHVTLRADGATVGAVESAEPLCAAFRDIYLGADPASPSLKDAVVATMVATLGAGAA